MKIAFYSPMKPPDHPVPSGDRLMAKLLMRALGFAGHDVSVVSKLRAFLSDRDAAAIAARQQTADAEIARLSALWERDGAPDLWFCYHPYYKAPDLLGPTLSRRFDLTYVTAEASYSPRRNEGAWKDSQVAVLDAVGLATVNLCFTARDENGLRAAAPQARFACLPAFIDATPYLAIKPKPEPQRLIAVAMMRKGDKLDSFRALARGLAPLADLSWSLDIIGDGPARASVEMAFASLPASRIRWQGLKETDEIATLLAKAALYVWPGHGEAYGLAYLEAQAAGLPVVAERIAGVPEVVIDGSTGILTAPGDTQAYAAAIRHLLESEPRRTGMAAKARNFAGTERSIERAALNLDEILKQYVGARP